MKNKYLKWILIACALLLLGYGTGRLYYRITDGFTTGNIRSDLPYNHAWAIASKKGEEKEKLDAILSQSFQYIGKGCQSYVFLSADGNYVLKFVKYQRFTPQAWLDIFEAVPVINTIRLQKIEKKQKKLDMLFTSWKTAYENLSTETGLVYVHLNKTKEFGKSLLIFDKMGFKHQINLDETEFLVQKKAAMLCPSIDAYMKENHEQKAVALIDNLLALILFEYARGLADNDHALMQNTGVLEGKPIHIDVGQFVKNEEVKKSEVSKQELYSKTFKFRKWLEKRYPSLASHLEKRLIEVIGSDYYTLKPQVKNHAWSEN